MVSYYNWTGFYVGINGGYGCGTSDWDVAARSRSSPKGGMIGGTLGYNWQTGAIVYGIEGDYRLFDDQGQRHLRARPPARSTNDWLATARLRLGYAFDRWLPYLTGGGGLRRRQGDRVPASTPPAPTT